MTPTPDPPGLSVVAIEDHLHRELPGLVQGPLSATLLAGGRSNLTYLLTDGRTAGCCAGHRWATSWRPRTTWAASTACSPPCPRPTSPCPGPCCWRRGRDRRAVLRHGVRRRPGPPRARRAGAVRPCRGTPSPRTWCVLSGCTARPERGGTGRPRAPRGLPGASAAPLGAPARSIAQPRPARAHPARRTARRGTPGEPGDAIVHGDYRLDNVVVDPAAATPGGPGLGDGHPRRPARRRGLDAGWWDGIRGLDSPSPRSRPTSRDPDGDHLLAAYGGRATSTSPRCPGTSASRSSRSPRLRGHPLPPQQGLTVGEGFDRLGDIVPPLVERGHASLSHSG